MAKGVFTFLGERVVLRTRKDCYGNSVILAYQKNEQSKKEGMTVFNTLNIPDLKADKALVNDGEVIVQLNGLNEIFSALLQSEYFQDTKKRIPTVPDYSMFGGL